MGVASICACAALLHHHLTKTLKGEPCSADDLKVSKAVAIFSILMFIAVGCLILYDNAHEEKEETIANWSAVNVMAPVNMGSVNWESVNERK